MDDPSSWGQWFRWASEGDATTFTALGDDNDARRPNYKASVRFIELRGSDRGVVAKTVLDFEFNRTTKTDVIQRLGGLAEPSVLAERGELGAAGLYRSALKCSKTDRWTYFLFATDGHLVGIAQATFDVDGAD